MSTTYEFSYANPHEDDVSHPASVAITREEAQRLAETSSR